MSTKKSNLIPLTLAGVQPSAGLYEIYKGDKGLSGNGLEYQTFSYGDASPNLLFNAENGNVIVDIKIGIINEFNGTNASISIGTLTEPEYFFPSQYVSPYEIAIFEVSDRFIFSSTIGIYLYISPGEGTTQGNGFILTSLI
jgi:hypothetical protein